MRFFPFALLVVTTAVFRLEGAEPPPNVLFISLDDLNDWVGCYGGHPDAKTPNIDRLAARAVVFTNAYCVSPICGPSRASVLTGRRPETTGVYHNRGKYLDFVPDAVSFPEHFRANGYVAMAAGKVNHDLGEPDPRLWDENGPDCGVLGTPFIGDELHTAKMTPERVIDRGSLKITLPANGGLSAIDRPNNTWDSFDWAPLDCPETDFPDRRIADWGVKQLQQKHGKPLLLALGFYKPHQPFFAPRKYFELYDPKTTRLPPTIAGDLDDVPAPGRDLATRPWTSGTHKTVAAHGAWRDAVRGYLATVSFADALVGRVVNALDKGPHADNTWIVLWSDHGWSLGEKEHWGKHVPWRESVRMPLMIVPPKNARPDGFKPGSRCDAAVSLLDLYPTLIAACSLPKRTELEGSSLLPLVANPASPWRDTVVTTVGRGTHSVSTKRWRYIRYFDGSEELYDLKADPREWSNLAVDRQHVAIKRKLASRIPIDKRLKQFVRQGRWKCVIPVEGAPMLFDYQGEFGISEQNDIAADHPEVVAGILSHVRKNKIDDRRIEIPTSAPATNSSQPIVTVKREVYVPNTKRGKAPWVYVFPGKGGFREEIHTEWSHEDQVRGYGDSPQNPRRRVSLDNGRTWSPLRAEPPWMTLLDKVSVLDWKFCGSYDPTSDRLVSLSIHHVRDMRQGPPRMIYNHALVRTSADGGRSYGPPQTLKYESGDDFDPQNVLNAAYLEKNTGYPGQSILRLRNGRLLIPVTNAKIPDDVPDEASSRARWPSKGTIGSLCYSGRWNKDREAYDWKAGKPVWLPRSIAFNGLLEADVAELADGRVLIVWRITKTPNGAAHKWCSVSSDGGMTFAKPKIFGYSDGTAFYSTSTFHRLFRSTKTGRLCWIGNINATAPTNPGHPRYPLVIAEVDEDQLALKRDTVTQIDTRQPGEGERLQLSNFWLIENTATQDLEIYLTRLNEVPDETFTASAYKYTLSFMR